jgi:hypothetical protein
MTYRGRIKNGVVVLERKAKLPEGTSVRVEPVSSPVKKPARTNGKPAYGLLKFAGMAKGLPRDMARNHDHYIHGSRA